MNEELPSDPREALDASLTALIVGELPQDQARFLCQALASDVELARRYDRLKRTVEMVRLAEAESTDPALKPNSAERATLGAPSPILKLSDQRREALLQKFKTVAPVEFISPQPRRTNWFVPVGIAALLMTVLSVALLPSLSRSKSRGMASAPNELALSERSLAENSKESSLLGMQNKRDLSRKLADAEPERQSGGNPTEIALPADSKTEPVGPEFSGRDLDLQRVQQSPEVKSGVPAEPIHGSGGLGGQLGGGTAGKPPGTQNQLAEAIEGRDRFLRRYGLAGNAPAQIPSAGQTSQKEPPAALAQTPPEKPAVIDPSTGLPVQIVEDSLAVAAAPQPPVLPSVVASMPETTQGVSEAKQPADLASLAPQPVSGTMERALGQSVAETDKLRRPVLGDEPSLGKVFQNNGNSRWAEKLSENPQSTTAGSTGSTVSGVVISGRATPSIELTGLTTNWSVSASLRAFYAESADDGAKAPSTSFGFQPDGLSWFDSSGIARSGLFAPDLNSAITVDRGQFGAAGKKDSAAVPGDQTVTFDLSSRGYKQKTEELADLQRSNQTLLAKIASEGIDQQAPKSSMVSIVDQATPAQSRKRGLLDRITSGSGGQFESVARLKVDATAGEKATASVNRSVFYDPYFLQTEFEIMQSDRILGRVAERLKLGQVWAKKRELDRPLASDEVLKTLRQKLDFKLAKGSDVLEIRAKDDQAAEAADIANAVAQEYAEYRDQQRQAVVAGGVNSLQTEAKAQQQKIAAVETELERLRQQAKPPEPDAALAKPALTVPVPQPEIQTSENAFSTFSLNVSDVSFKLAAASLEKGVLPEPGAVRAEEFINAFDYRDPEPAPGAPFAFAWERAQYPFAHNRDLLRLSLKTASQGRQAGRPLNLVLLLDNSGSMERADRVRIIHEALRVLATQLQAQDTLSVVTFARTARLWVDGVSGTQAGQVAEQLSGLTPEGGTNLEEAMNLAYQTALRHYRADGINRVVLLTDGAANLGNVSAESLKQKVETNRKQGIALDCFGIGWEGYNDDLLEVLTRNGDGRYGFINTPEEAADGFAGQLAGALRVAASDVKVQVEFNPTRVASYRQIGYARHQLTAQQFRDNSVDAAELGAAESGNALYAIEVNPNGDGPLATVRVRFKVPGSTEYQEYAWLVPYAGNAAELAQSSPAMRLAAMASAFAEWLSASPYAAEVTPQALLGCLSGVPGSYGADPRPQKLEWMIRQAQALGNRPAR